MPKLKPKTKRILRFIKRYQREYEYPPTIREIQAAHDISSTSVVYYHLRLLQDSGYIARKQGQSRALRVLK